MVTLGTSFCAALDELGAGPWYRGRHGIKTISVPAAKGTWNRPRQYAGAPARIFSVIS